LIYNLPCCHTCFLPRQTAAGKISGAAEDVKSMVKVFERPGTVTEAVYHATFCQVSGAGAVHVLTCWVGAPA